MDEEAKCKGQKGSDCQYLHISKLLHQNMHIIYPLFLHIKFISVSYTF